MALKVYHKEKVSRLRGALRTFSYVALIGGMLIMFWAYYPLIFFEVYAALFIQNDYAAPVPESQEVTSLQFANTLYSQQNILSQNLKDFTRANVWFPVTNISNYQQIDFDDYTISIPKLQLDNLKVEVGGDDLSRSLIHYVPTSKPGQYGKVAIFGHSTLPQLYNKSDYKSIFTFLPQVNIGDVVNVHSDDRTYEYEVFNMYIVQPDQVSVLEQNFNASTIMLVTCVPPGTYAKRLIVEAKLRSL